MNVMCPQLLHTMPTPPSWASQGGRARGAGTMGAYVGLLNAIREKGRKELIGWVKDAAHCLM